MTASGSPAPRRWHPTDRDQLAQCLSLTPRQIDLVSTGATDHSTDLGGAVLAATFARRHYRPVCLMVGPPMFGQGGGPVIALRYRHHARPDGTLVAVHAEIDLEAGPYAGLAEALVAEFCAVGAGPYRVPAVDLRVRALRSTSAPPMLEPGLAAAAVAFAVEAQLDRLADRISSEQGRESAQFVATRRAVRQRNLLGLDDPLPTGQVLLEDSAVAALLTALDAAAAPECPDLGPDHAWGTGIGAGILPFGLGEAVQVPVRARGRGSRRSGGGLLSGGRGRRAPGGRRGRGCPAGARNGDDVRGHRGPGRGWLGRLDRAGRAGCSGRPHPAGARADRGPGRGVGVAAPRRRRPGAVLRRRGRPPARRGHDGGPRPGNG